MTEKKRLIDADALIETLSIVAKKMAKSDAQKALMGRILYIIEHKPTVDAVEVVHGRWIGMQYDGYADGSPVYDLWECSECREEYESEGDPPPYKYCPNCGARMDGDGNG